MRPPKRLFCFVLFGLQLSVCLCWRLVPLRVLSDALLKRRNGAPAPRWLREEPLAPKCPPTLNEVRCPGIADPVIHGQASAVLEPTPHVSGLSGDWLRVFGTTNPVLPSTLNGRHIKVRKYS